MKEKNGPVDEVLEGYEDATNFRPVGRHTI